MTMMLFTLLFFLQQLTSLRGQTVPDYHKLRPLSERQEWLDSISDIALSTTGKFVIGNQSIPCPCNDTSLCGNVQVEHEQELFGFAGRIANLSLYNWTYLTSIAWPPSNDPSLTCVAHNHSVRLIAKCPSDYPLTSNITERQVWIEYVFNQTIYSNYDGVTFDYESPCALYSTDCLYYLELINQTTRYFHEHLPHSQVSVCVPWQPYNQGNRNDDWLALSQASDLLFIMFYDTQAQVFDRQCIASANSPVMNGVRGLSEYLDLGIDPKKLVLGVPWYGYNYTCDMTEMESNTSKYCPIKMVNFRGANCSDAAGGQISYAKSMNLIDEGLNITQIRFDDNTKSPYFNAKKKDNETQVYQVWFDNPDSLRYKYSAAKSFGIRGVGIFTINEGYNSDFTPAEVKRVKEMWRAFDSFYQ